VAERADPLTRTDSLPWTPALIRLMAGLMLAIFVAAMDATVVATALPTIARELGNFSLYSWVFTGYLLTSTTTVPLWGRAADIAGRRRIVLIGLAIFVASSVLCGLSPNMLLLILFRSLQGVGAGCLQPVVFTIVGDVFPVAQRARLQGFFSGMWAIAAVIGPVLGAVFVSTIGWRWIFMINLPIGIVAAFLLWGYQEHRPEDRSRAIDIPGGLVLTAGVALLLIGLGAGSSEARPIWPVLGLAVVLLGTFAVIERQARSPAVPLDLLRHPTIGPAIVASVLGGTVMFGLTAYVPLYVQDALGGTAYAAGASVAPMSLGWPVGSVLAGRILMRVGYRPLIVSGAAWMVIGALLLVFGPPAIVTAAIACAIIGLGLGLLSTPILILIQSSVEWSKRGAATALNQFGRTIGGAVGVAVMGVLLQAALAGRTTTELLHSGDRVLLGAGVHTIFWVIFGVAAAALALCLAILAGGDRWTRREGSASPRSAHPSRAQP
jgi:EmrB/QacA subfamily drug resistance transporter